MPCGLGILSLLSSLSPTALILCGLATAPAAGQIAAPDSTAFLVSHGDTLWLAPPLQVVGSRVPAALPGALRPVGVLDQGDLRSLPGRSAAEYLQTQPGVVTGQRQQYGVQSDLTIRGSTFEQVQVLLDGYDLGDPQTGHHLLDLPLGTHDIARLEVLPGHGSALYGSGAFGGTVNVVPKIPATASPPDQAAGLTGEIAALGGGQGTWGGWGAASAGLGPATDARLSAEVFRTDGHDVRQADGTEASAGNEAETWTATGRVVHGGPGGTWDAFAGAASRDFGARDFYAPFPSRERTRTLFCALRHNRALSRRLTIEPRVHFRRHTDWFVLRRDHPEAYTNDHRTRRAGAELRGIVDLGRGYALALSLDGLFEDIHSRGLRDDIWLDALGAHVRRRGGAALEIDGRRGPLRWQTGGRVDGRRGEGPRFSGTAAAAVQATGALTIQGSMGSVFRVPTFTELYYADPGNLGDPGLRPEHGWTWDFGAQWRGGAFSLRAGYFERYERDLIEWARPAGADPATVPWRVMNIAEGTVRGTETLAVWTHPRGHILSAAWTWLEKQTALPAGFQGKYSLLVPRQVLAAQGRLVLPRGLELALAARYLERTGGPDDFRAACVLDGRVGWGGADGWQVTLTVTNLLDRSTQEVPGVALPGRLATLSVGREF